MAAPQVKTIRAKNLIILFGEHRLEGFEEGEFVQVFSSSPRFKSIRGLGGAVVPIMTMDRRATVHLKLFRQSPSNLVLAELVKKDETSALGLLPFYLKDQNGQDLYHSLQARIVREPDLSAGDRQTSMLWVFELYSLVRQSSH